MKRSTITMILISSLISWNVVGCSFREQRAETQQNLEENYAKALKAYDMKDYDQAFPLFQKAAKQGDQNAQFYLGVMYYNGYSVMQDKAEAAKWFRKAAEQGESKAQKKLKALGETW